MISYRCCSGPKTCWINSVVGSWLFNRIRNCNPVALGARYSAFNHDNTTVEVCADHLQVLCDYTGVTHVTGHLLAFENLALILTLASGTMRTVRYGHTVRGPKTTKVVTLHRTLETFTD